MFSTDLLAPLKDLFAARDRFLVISHVRPDGDAYGSSLALGLSLRAAGKDVLIVNEDGLGHLFRFLPGSTSLTVPAPKPPEADRLIIAVDCADQKRLGPVFESWQRPPDVNIDHHVSNPGYAKVNLIDAESPATAQLLFETISALGLPLTAEVAANLYVGLMTDTGCFRYRQTTARTFEIASQLVAAGANPTDLAENCYSSFRVERLLLVREVFNGLKLANHDRVAWFHLSPETYARSGAAPDETEGLIEFLQAVKTVEVAFLLEKLPDGMTRGSLRSRGKVDVQQICATFGGGGHRLAAGLRSRLEPEVLEKKLLDLIAEQLGA